MHIDAFDFALPDRLIALHPARPRDAARLLVASGNARPEFADRHVSDLPGFLRSGDVVVFNDTRVIALRLRGRWRDPISGRERGVAEALLLHRKAPDKWLALVRPRNKLKLGSRLCFGGEGTDETAGISAWGPDGQAELKFALSGPALDAALARWGEMPLPPYIAKRRRPAPVDEQDYQTLHAARDGAVAAPTAGLHFTPRLMEALAERGIGNAMVTLHIGVGTFAPVRVQNIADHVMHAEWGEITAQTAAGLNRVRQAGGRVVAIGTTAARLLETAADDTGRLHAFRGMTNIFITPGYRFKVVDALLTNFHLPRSSLLMMIGAFVGMDAMRSLYAQAIARQYRFYSYGDACLLFRRNGTEERAARR